MGEYEIRTVEGELRVEARGLAPLIRGYAIVYDRLSEELHTPFGTFREQIAPEAITTTLARGEDLRALVDHDPAKPLGRVKAGTLRVDSDAHGLRVEIDPPHTTAGHDIVESIRRGDVSGMSFAFRTIKDAWNPDQTIRTVLDMLVREVSIVTFPAYQQTEVAMRSQTAARADQAARYPRGRTVAERRAWATAHAR
jgi:uncharacterized protein